MPSPKQFPARLRSRRLGLSLILSHSFRSQPATIQFCLQDRVIINRIDNICHAILKGKWPSSSQQFETPTLLTAPAVPSSASSRNSFAESEASDPSFNNGVLISQVQKVWGGPWAGTGLGLWDEELPRNAQEFSKRDLASHCLLVPLAVYNVWLEPLGPLH